MSILIGTAGIPSNADSILSGIQSIHDMGLDSMEVEFVRGVNMGPELAKKAGELAKKLNVNLSVHAPYYINLCNPEKKSDSEKRIILSCDRAKELGASVVVFHAGFYGKLSKEESVDMVTSSCKSMAKHLKHNVLLGIETTGKKSQFGTLDEILEICKSVHGCVPVIDFSHIYARNNGKLDIDEIIFKIKSAGIKNIHCHFSGIEFSEAGERKHLPIGDGGPDFKAIALDLHKEKISATIICESPLLEKDALKMKKIVQNIENSIKN